MKKQEINNKYNDPFPTQLRDLIEGNNTTIQAVAEIVGVSRQAVSQYYNGLTQPNADTIIKIAKYFNVSTDYLLGLTDKRTPNTELRAMCEYTGLTETAIKMLREKRKSPTVSQIIESNEFWDIVQNINSALINFDTLYPSGKINAESAAAQMGTKINWNDNNKNVDLSKLPTEYQKYLGVVSEQGTKPLYKHLLTEIISRLFDNIINDKMKR